MAINLKKDEEVTIKGAVQGLSSDEVDDKIHQNLQGVDPFSCFPCSELAVAPKLICETCACGCNCISCL